MSDPRAEQIEACLKLLEEGSAPQQLIATHPDLQGEIEAAVQANRLHDPQIPAEIRERSRTHLLVHATELRNNQPAAMGIFNRLPRLAIAAIIALFIFLSGSSLMITSARSLPGDQLYPVKRAVEELRINLSVATNQQKTIEAQYQERRIQEVKELLNQGRIEKISFEGEVTEQGIRHWTIEEILVIVTPETQIVGEIEPGMIVEVEGITQPQGWVQASTIQLRAYELSGIVESLTAETWVISGQKLRILPETQIDPQIQVGDRVQVTVHTEDDGSLSAARILFISPGSTVTPIPSPTLQETPMESPTPIPAEENPGEDEHEEQEQGDETESESESEFESETEEEGENGPEVTETSEDEELESTEEPESTQESEDDNKEGEPKSGEEETENNGEKNE